MTAKRIAEVQQRIFELNGELGALMKQSRGIEVPNDRFATAEGEVSLLELFAGRDLPLAIHNMGQGCRYRSLWSLLALAGMDAQNWIPQFSCWQRPDVLDDGGQSATRLTA